MRVYLGSDHAGFDLKNALVEYLSGAGHQVVDCGPTSFEPDDDYPPFCIDTALRVVADPNSLGVVIGGSGNGEQIAANKVSGVRAALAYNIETAQLARQHNDANVVAIGARMHAQDEAIRIVDTFLGTSFSHDPRHVRRIAMVTAYEQTGSLRG